MPLVGRAHVDEGRLAQAGLRQLRGPVFQFRCQLFAGQAQIGNKQRVDGVALPLNRLQAEVQQHQRGHHDRRNIDPNGPAIHEVA